MPHPRHYGLTHIRHPERLAYANAVRRCPRSAIDRARTRRRRRVGLKIIGILVAGPLTILAMVILGRLIMLWNGR